MIDSRIKRDDLLCHFSYTATVVQIYKACVMDTGAGTGPAGPAMAGPFSTEVEP